MGVAGGVLHFSLLDFNIFHSFLSQLQPQLLILPNQPLNRILKTTHLHLNLSLPVPHRQPNTLATRPNHLQLTPNSAISLPEPLILLHQFLHLGIDLVMELCHLRVLGREQFLELGDLVLVGL